MAEDWRKNPSNRIYPKLEPEEVSAVLSEFANDLAAGLIQPKIPPYFLDIEFEQFSFNAIEPDVPLELKHPPEFTHLSVSVLDVYAAALLSTDAVDESRGLLRFACALQLDGEGELKLRLSVTPEHEAFRIPSSLILPMLTRLAQGLYAKQLDTGSLVLLTGEGCPMQMDWPGYMKAAKSPWLKDRPREKYPQAYLDLLCTPPTLMRARAVMDFLLEGMGVDKYPLLFQRAPEDF